MNESSIQEAVARYLDAKGIFWMHVPNESPRAARYGARLKRHGMKRGAPDIVIMQPPPAKPEARGVMIELKSEGGRLQPSQAAFLAKASAHHWECAVCYGLREAMRYLGELGF